MFMQVWAVCEEITLASSRELKDRLTEAETEIVRLRGDLAGKEEELTQLRVLNNLNQGANSQLGQNVERLKAVLRLLIEDRRAERSAFQVYADSLRRSPQQIREEALRVFKRVAAEALPGYHQVLEDILQGLLQGSPEMFPAPFAV